MKSIAQCYQMSMESVEVVAKYSDNHKSSTEAKEKCIELSTNIPDTLRHLLLKYQRVFDLPKGLPPSRMCDHRIPLQPNSNPVKVRPYIYPHSQKTKIENIVDHMLKEGLIEPSNNPFFFSCYFGQEKRWNMAILYILQGLKCYYCEGCLSYSSCG